jgi:ASC-1-like (ASCH) protein
VLSIKPGDVIEFSHFVDENLPKIITEVIEVLRYPTFRDALEALPISEVLPIPGLTVDEGDDIYKRYVSLATQEKDGVAMIKIRLLHQTPVVSLPEMH